MMRAWLLALAVASAAPAAAAGDVVATRTLRIGSILTEADLRARDPRDRVRIDGMVGQEVRRVIYAGRPVAEGDLGPPTLVQRNDVVVMVYSVGVLDMRTEGRALDRGGKGEVIDVMTLSSRQKVRATVTGPGRVQVRR